MSQLIWPGGTQTQAFTGIPFAHDEVSKVIVTYTQQGENKIVRTVTDISADETDPTMSAITYKLTQAESLTLESGEPCTIQLNVYLDDTNRIPSVPFKAPCGVQYYREAIT